MLLPFLFQPISHDTPSGKYFNEASEASRCWCLYIHVGSCWRLHWQDRRHSRCLCSQCSIPSLRMRLPMKKYRSMSGLSLLKPPMWFNFEFTSDTNFCLFAGECIYGKMYTYIQTYRQTGLTYYVNNCTYSIVIFWIMILWVSHLPNNSACWTNSDIDTNLDADTNGNGSCVAKENICKLFKEVQGAL